MGPPGFEFPGISLPGSHGHARGWVRPHRAVRPTRLDYGPPLRLFLIFLKLYSNRQMSLKAGGDEPCQMP